MPRGEIENISGAPLIITALGWVMPTGHTETIDETTASTFTWVNAESELSALITSGDIEVRSETGLTILSNGILDWLGTSAVNTPQQHILTAVLSRRVPNAGERFLGWTNSISHTEVAWPAASNYTVLRITIGVKQVESTAGYGIRIYDSSDLNTPVYSSGEILPNNTLSAGIEVPVSPSPVQLPPSEYAFAMYRTSGSTRSDFTEGIVNVFLRRED